MSRPSKWWWGLLPLAVLWLLAIFFKTAAVEEDVHARAGTTVAASDLAVEVAGRDVTLAGALLTEETRDAVEDTRGVRLVRAAVQDTLARVSEDATLAAPGAYDWSIRRDDGVVVLSGRVPSASARARIATAARAAFPEAEIRDETEVAAGAPAGVEGAAIYALGQAARLPDGRVSLSGDEYSIAGTAPTPEAYEELLAATRDLPEGLTLGDVNVLPPGESVGIGEDATDQVAEGDEAYDWSLRRDAGVTVLSGRVPSASARTRIAAAARAAFPEAEIRDETEVAAGAPAGVEEAALYALGQAARLPDGRVSLSGGEYSIAGTAPTPGAYEGLLAEMRDLPEGLTLGDVGILPPGEPAGRGKDATGVTAERAAETSDAEPSEVAEARVPTTDAAGGAASAQADACRRRLAEVVERSRFQFETGSSALSMEATGALDELAAAAGNCLEIQGESIRVGIAGHTDAVGSEAFNLELSRRRAQAAVDHLTRAGVPTAELTMTGYGESRPVASNDTETGRAQNRRIEIEVQ